MLCRGVAGIEDLREKREEVNRQILRDEEEKAKVQRVCAAGLCGVEEREKWAH